MDHDINEMIATIWRDKGGTAKTFNESWQFIEHMIAEKEKEAEENPYYKWRTP